MNPRIVHPFQNLDVWGFWVNADYFAPLVPYIVKPEQLAARRN